MDKINEILNEDYKNKTWFLKNYFWVGTVFVILLCNLLFLFGGNCSADKKCLILVD